MGKCKEWKVKKRTYRSLVGDKYNRLTVIAFLSLEHGHKRRYRCRCECGTTTSVLDYNLRNGAVKSCGCLRVELGKILSVTHGHSCDNKISPEYRTWRNMLKRCYFKKEIHYKNYGGRGITVCSRWKTSFINFLKDMGLKPGKHLTLDRINNDKGYFKDNCRWATRSEQIRNSRTCIK